MEISVPKPKSLHEVKKDRKPIRNVNAEHEAKLGPMAKLALYITEHVGTMGFFLLIFFWTVLWCGFNILATEVPRLHWTAFDPFPAFVAYLLMSNVVQILLMPLIMVGQNIQGAHSELRAQSDYEINCKAEKEVELILHHLEYQNAILMKMLEKLGVSVDEAITEVKSSGADA
jgi:uncharacterized membrane protein